MKLKMEKSRDAKIRGAIRLKHSKPKLSSSSTLGHLGSEAKREKRLMKLSSVVRPSSSSLEDCQMESLSTSKDEDGVRSFGGNSSNATRFKFHEKLVDDCNGVGHASVPRRLRSAMKKRSRDSISPPLPYSKKVKTHTRDLTNSTKIEVNKKSKSNMKQKGPERSSKKRILSGPITKDEEEVAATLFALAELFADNNTNDESKGKHESLEEPNNSDVSKSNESRPQTVDVEKKHSVACETSVPSSNTERLPETVKDKSWNEPNVQNEPKHAILNLSSDDYVSLVTSHSLPDNIESLSDVKPLSMPSDLISDVRLSKALQKNVLFLERKPETALRMATPIGSQTEQPRHKLDDSNKNGLSLWPGLPSTPVSKAARVEDSSLASPASKLPGWLDDACSGPSIRNESFAKVPKVTVDRRRFKRCATHVYISRLIQALRISEAKDRFSPMPQSQTITQEGSVINGVGIGVNGVISICSINNAIAKQSSIGDKNSGVLQPRSHRDESHQTTESKWQNQSYDLFMSLARGGGMEVNGSYRNGAESQNPYLSSFAQQQALYNSNRFPLARQVQMQPPSYSSQFHGPQSSLVLEELYHLQQQKSQQEEHQRLWVGQHRSTDETSRFNGAQVSPKVMTKHHHLQHQQQSQQEAYQQLLAAQYRPEETPKPTIQFLNLQNGPTSQYPYSGGKITRQDRHLPSVYEKHGGRFRTNSLVPLQLLCNERR